LQALKEEGFSVVFEGKKIIHSSLQVNWETERKSTEILSVKIAQERKMAEWTATEEVLVMVSEEEVIVVERMQN
jgi:hypothetical protein